MNSFKIDYKIKKATEAELSFHLKKCNDNFYPKLDERVNLKEYSKKLFEKSVTFEAWEGPVLIGLVAAYLNDVENHLGYITNVSVLTDYLRTGIAAELMNICVGYAEEQNFKEIKLEVYKDNVPAIELYKRFKFDEFGKKDDFILMSLTLMPKIGATKPASFN